MTSGLLLFENYILTTKVAVNNNKKAIKYYLLMLTMQSHERFPVALNSRFLDRNEVELFQYVFSREGGECFI